MRFFSPRRLGLAAAIGLLFSHSAMALPPVTKAHPRVYATQADFDRVALEAGIRAGAFPSAGTVSFDLIPVVKGPKDVAGAPIFGQDPDNGSSANGFLIFYTSDDKGLYVAANLYGANGASFVWLSEQPLIEGQRNRISFTYDANARTAKLVVNGRESSARNWTDPWQPSAQQFSFRSHRGDVIENFKLAGPTATDVLWQSARIDPELHTSWRAILGAAKTAAAQINACGTTASDICNDIREKGRKEIMEPARHLAMAYRYTGDPALLAAIREHIRLLKGVSPLTTGGEWSMGARVGTLGLYYDWLYSYLDPSERDAIAAHIKATIRADKLDGNPNLDLIYSACGHQGLSATVLDCAQKPVFQDWNRYATPALPSTSDTYISGHAATGVSLTAAALLAIVEDGAQPKHTDVVPMLDTIYSHFKLGYLRARDLYSVDGGNPSLFSYASAAGETSERLVMWQRALSGNSGLQLASQQYYLYPYLYALRADGSFPARGDSYTFPVELAGALALGSRMLNPDNTDPNAPEDQKYIIDPVAYAFYTNKVQPVRAARNTATLWERLIYPQKQPRTPLTMPTELARHFRTAGNVIVRNTWDNATNTLLEFKSASFISENHHHLDQNSFSLYYKAPLLVDSGQYDDYNTTHWRNYYQRTIAHNAIVLDDTNKDYYKQDYYYDNKYTSRDGGQWYANKLVKRATYPTIEEALLPGGSNLLHGVTGFEDGGDYVYVAGNASKAYPSLDSSDKYIVDQNAGMQRSIVYLRRPDSRLDVTPPLVLVFDSVRSKVKATSLLHTVGQPAADAGATRLGAGRYQYGSGAGLFTVRNGGGMLTVQTLLPKSATRSVGLVGGQGNPNDVCKQYKRTKVGNEYVDAFVADAADCRFLVRHSDNQWVNYPPRTNKDDPTDPGAVSMPANAPDIGAWRLEISDSAALPADAAGYKTQYFLNALHVADTDGASGGVATLAQPAALLPVQSADTAAVKVNSDLVVVFNGGATTGTTLQWQPGSYSGKTLVVGLQKNGCYALDKSAPMWQLKPVAASCTHTASANGVVQLP
ncbi:heparinase II/III family protein [[Empedobacter] haloabium]|uniref:Heparinase II/III family protein n=1 Tax=[Empedobacter] haloabium TaxID=592317 RepID=A0ABZ1UQG0_9BURK